jgi:ERCC4-type nuclease
VTKPIQFPSTIVVDTREQTPFTFSSIRADAREGGGLLTIPTVRATLRSGDYSLLGHETAVAIERKSKADLYGTVSAGRGRFERELTRLNAMTAAAIVVEAELSTLLADPPDFTRYSPKSLIRSVMAWQHRYPRVHWWFVPGREVAESVVVRWLEKYLQAVEKRAELTVTEITLDDIGGLPPDM